MTEQRLDLQVLHRAAVHLAARNPGFAAEPEMRIRVWGLDVTAGTANALLQEQP